MELVERQDLLVALEGFAREARAGRGRVVLIGGEAGVGKSSLVRAFVEPRTTARRVLWGSCDPLSTPEPLAPFRDARPLRGVLAAHAGRLDLLEALLDELARTPPTVMVLEDVHWADDATLDAIRFLGRRVHATTGLLIATFREEEAAMSAGLRGVLGDLATAIGARRLRVPPLTADGVAELAAGAAIEPARLHAVTGGNPFFVTEVLAAPGWTVPPTVGDAVMARIARLDPGARGLVEVIALAPGGLEAPTATVVAGAQPAALDRCVELGVLVEADGRLTFRHELARLAVEGSIPASRQRRLHAELLAHLERADPVDAARAAHHAAAAGDAAAVLRHAPVAAREASERFAHRVAADHLRRAVDAADTVAPEQLGGLLATLADERQLFDDPRSVLELRRRTLDVQGRSGNRLGEAHELLEMARLMDAIGEDVTGWDLVRRALAILEGLPQSPELARAHAMAAYAAHAALRLDDALEQATAAASLARRMNGRLAYQSAIRVRASVLNLRGTGDEASQLYAEFRAIAEAAGDREGVVIALIDEGADFLYLRRYDDASRRLREAIDLGRAADLDLRVAVARSLLAVVAFEEGRWDEAEDILARQLERWSSEGTEFDARATRGRIGVRRGTPGSATMLADAWRAIAAGTPSKRWDLAAGRAEAAWLAGRAEEIPAIVSELWRGTRAAGLWWPADELAFWLWRSGALHDPSSMGATPYALHVAGDWRAAADGWAAIGCPYEQAEALADGDEPAMRQALAIFSRLGAVPAADRLRARMRRAGFNAVPPRPRASTRAAPAQLTGRQLEILRLLADGLSDREIAERLFITEKTAGHHVSAVLAKLAVRSRGEAAAAARKMGIAAP